MSDEDARRDDEREDAGAVQSDAVEPSRFPDEAMADSSEADDEPAQPAVPDTPPSEGEAAPEPSPDDPPAMSEDASTASPDAAQLADMLQVADADQEPGPSWLPADGRPLVEEDEEGLRRSISAGIEQLGDAPEELVPMAADLPARELRAAVEALLLVATRPLTVDRIAKCLPGTDGAYIQGLLEGLAERYAREYRGWELRPMGGGWQLLTRPALHPWVRQLDKRELPTRLSRSAMETLAVVAYKQPVMRGQIEDVRGVQCGPMLRQLMDLKLVQVVGRDDEAVGRPLLYGTTDAFLDRFGLGSLADLPRKHEFGD